MRLPVTEAHSEWIQTQPEAPTLGVLCLENHIKSRFFLSVSDTRLMIGLPLVLRLFWSFQRCVGNPLSPRFGALCTRGHGDSVCVPSLELTPAPSTASAGISRNQVFVVPVPGWFQSALCVILCAYTVLVLCGTVVPISCPPGFPLSRLECMVAVTGK